MTDESRNDKERGSEALRNLLGHLSETLRSVSDSSGRDQEREALMASASEMVEKHGGIIVPMPLDLVGLSPVYARLIQDLTDEQAKASLFLSQIGREHPYREVFKKLAEAWTQAAMIGALHIAKHLAQEHGHDFEVGPREYGLSWSNISMAAVLGAVRYGQEHPDAFKGLDDLKEGEIDEYVSELIAWAEQEHAKEPETEEKDPDKEA